LVLLWTVVSITVTVMSACAPPREIRTLEEVRASGRLRVVVPPGFDTLGTSPDPTVDEAQLIRQLAARLGVRVEWLVADRVDQPLRWLREGRADLAVGRYAPDDLDGSGVVPTAVVGWVDDVLVLSPEMESVSSRYVGLPVWTHPSRLRPTITRLLEERGAVVQAVPAEVPLQEVVARVRVGRYPAAIVDTGVLDRMPASARPAIGQVLIPRRQLVWAVPERAPWLRRAVDDFLFAEQVLGRSTRLATCRDLEAILQAGALRLITDNSPTTCRIDRGGLDGFEYELVREYARRIGVRLDLVLPPPGHDASEWLELGYGDLVSLHSPVAPSDTGRFLVTPTYREVDLVVVVPAGVDPPAAVWDLGGRRVAASRAVRELVRRLPVDPPIIMPPLTPGADMLSALRAVSRGEAEAAIVDADLARLEVEERPDLQLGPTAMPSVDLAWIVNVSSPELHRSLSRYLVESRRDGWVRRLVRSDLGSWRPPVPVRRPEVPTGSLSPFDEVLRWAGRRHGIDWRLLASLMYEESRFDPGAVGPGGSAGLFQFMPFTWRELGVEDPHHPADAAEAGARYLRRLMDLFDDLPLPDRVAMAIAGYNVGPGHVFDARRLARRLGYDPDRWSGNVEVAMLLLDDPEVAREYPSGVCRCRRAVNYTRRILRRYHAYAEEFPPA
jgi:membrane-bound lytic murein transglycosylase F